MPRQRVYLFAMLLGVPALAVSYVVGDAANPVVRWGWPPLLAHLLGSVWVLLRHPGRVVAVERATLAAVTVLFVARMAWYLLTQPPAQAWASLSPGSFMGLVLLVVFGYLVLGTGGGLRFGSAVVGVSTVLAVLAVVPAEAAGGQWTVTVAVLRAEVYVIVTAVFVHALARTKDEAATARLEAQRMHDLAHRDVLTGLPNRRRAEELLGAHAGDGAAGVGAGDRAPLAVLSVDVDWFKQVNDEHGHAVGDAVLRDVAAALRDAVPPGATVARWGGEEFVVVAPGAGATAALALGERLRAAVAACALPGGLALTASVGAACRRGDDDVASLLGRVDERLYAAKACGRDAVRGDGEDGDAVPAAGALSRDARRDRVAH